MCNKVLLIGTAFLLGAVMVFSSLAIAQEEGNMDPLVAQEEVLSRSFGEVVSVSDNVIVAKESELGAEAEDINVSYIIDADTKLENVNSVTEIQAGDNVDIDYIVKGEEKVANFIEVESKLSEEDDSSEVVPEATEIDAGGGAK